MCKAFTPVTVPLNIDLNKYIEINIKNNLIIFYLVLATVFRKERSARLKTRGRGRQKGVAGTTPPVNC